MLTLFGKTYAKNNSEFVNIHGLSTITELYIGVPKSYKTQTEELIELFNQ